MRVTAGVPDSGATSAAAQPPREIPTTAATLAQSPPVNGERVAQVRKAIEEGRFPLSPATIADSLIALKLDWISREPS